jgi:hypothetical protein
MPWSKITPPQTRTPHDGPETAVPSSEAIRRAALSASWERDRRVASRRLAVRWLLWAWWRIGLPLLLALGLAITLLWQVSPARLPAWLSPIFLSVNFSALSGKGVAPAAAAPPFEQHPHRKEP